MKAPTGHLQVKGPPGKRGYYVLWRDAEGQHQRKLGPAHVRDSGKRTVRGAVIWRAADGPKPTPEHLTPKEAQGLLTELLSSAPKGERQNSRKGSTFGAACDELLRYSEQEKQVAVTTLAGYRAVITGHLLPHFGAATPLNRITRQRVEQYRQELAGGSLAPRSQQAIMQVLGAALRRAKRLGWIATNPAEDVEPVKLRRSGDFNVLTVEEVHAVARAADAHDGAQGESSITPAVRLALVGRVLEDRWPVAKAAREAGVSRTTADRWLRRYRAGDHELHGRSGPDFRLGDLIRVAAFTGLRLGELRALRWRDVDFGLHRILVRESAPTSARGVKGGGVLVKAPKSGKVRSVPMSDQVAATLDQMTRRVEPDPMTLVFPSSGGFFDASAVRKGFNAAMRAGGLGHKLDQQPAFRFHDLRHTMGTLAAQHAPLHEVQAWLGHADLATTMRYAHYVPQADAAARLSAAFGGQAAEVPEPDPVTAEE